MSQPRRTMTEIGTLCYIIKDDKILLIRKKRGLGRGKFNGSGGKLEYGEGPLEGAKREVREETGLEIKDPEILGELDFYNGESFVWKVYILKTEHFTGNEIDTDEAQPV